MFSARQWAWPLLSLSLVLVCSSHTGSGGVPPYEISDLLAGDVAADSGTCLLQRQAKLLQGSAEPLFPYLLQGAVANISNISNISNASNMTPVVVATTTTTTTTTTTDFGPYYLIASSSTTGSIYSWNSATLQQSVLVPNAGSNPSGIAFDHNLGYIYYSDPGGRQIVRYELCFRNGEISLYDDQPVPIAMGVDVEWIAVNDLSNIFWTDPVGHAIKKMYFNTIDQIATGQLQPNALSFVSYMDIFLQLGSTVPSYCYAQTVFPLNCSANVTCNACQDLYLHAYVYELYSGVGYPSGIQQMPGPGNKLLWGNLVGGFTRGSVVEAQAEPMFLPPGATSFPIRAISYLWDSVFNFIQLPDTTLGQGTLFITTNGTLGIPAIPGDVVGALVAITPNSSVGPSQALVLDWNLDRPRMLAWNGHEKLYIADNAGIKIVNPQMLNVGYLSSLETTAMVLPGAAGLIEIGNSAPCYPLMVDKGLIPVPSQFR